MSTTLSVTSPSLDPEELNQLTLDICRTINDETDVTATPAEISSRRSGVKGDMLTIGSLVIGLLSSGGVVALINVLKSYMDRGRPIEIELERPDGKKLKLKSDNIQQEQLDQTMKLANDFFGVSS